MSSLWEEKEDGFHGLDKFLGYKIVKRYLGRGKYVFYGYKEDKFVSVGRTFDEARTQLERWIRKNGAK